MLKHRSRSRSTKTIEQELIFPSIILLCASSKSGKSHEIKNIIYTACKQGRFSYGLVFSASAFNSDYSFMSEEYVHGMWDKAVLKRFIEGQKVQIQRYGAAKPAFLVLDDMVGSIKWNSDFMRSFITRFRHYNLTVVIASQYIYAIPPIIRECVTYAIIFKQMNKRSIDALKDTFFVEQDSFNACRDFIAKHTVGYNFLLIRPGEELKHKYTVACAPAVIPDFYLDF
jgi:hypothetical protein